MIAWKAGRESIRAINDALLTFYKQLVVVMKAKINDDNDSSVNQVKRFSTKVRYWRELMSSVQQLSNWGYAIITSVKNIDCSLWVVCTKLSANWN
jgi:hypothetical protein